MATDTADQVLSDSVDSAGVSIVTATRTVDNPRLGSIYNPDTLAAADPVWFHRAHDGRYLALFRMRWHTATAADTTGPTLYSDYIETSIPCYAWINPTTGVADGPHPWPGLDALSAAVSRDNYMFTLGLDANGNAAVQHIVFTRLGGLQFHNQEVVPAGYYLGLHIDGRYLYVYGIGDDGYLARVRRNWGRIGINDPQMPWEYETPKGWTADPDEAASMPGDLPADGPCSVGKFRDRLYVMTTRNVVDDWQGVLYSARPVDPVWKPVSAPPIDLGDDDTYLGGTAYLQSQLVPRPEALGGARAGFCWVSSTRLEIGSDEAMVTRWGIVSV